MADKPAELVAEFALHAVFAHPDKSPVVLLDGGILFGLCIALADPDVARAIRQDVEAEYPEVIAKADQAAANWRERLEIPNA